MTFSPIHLTDCLDDFYSWKRKTFHVCSLFRKRYHQSNEVHFGNRTVMLNIGKKYFVLHYNYSTVNSSNISEKLFSKYWVWPKFTFNFLMGSLLFEYNLEIYFGLFDYFWFSLTCKNKEYLKNISNISLWNVQELRFKPKIWIPRRAGNPGSVSTTLGLGYRLLGRRYENPDSKELWIPSKKTDAIVKITIFQISLTKKYVNLDFFWKEIFLAVRGVSCMEFQLLITIIILLAVL